MPITDAAIDAAVPSDVNLHPMQVLANPLLKKMRGEELLVPNPATPYAWDPGQDPVIRISALDHDLTINAAGAVDGQLASLIVEQDAIGSRVVTPGTNVLGVAAWSDGPTTERALLLRATNGVLRPATILTPERTFQVVTSTAAQGAGYTITRTSADIYVELPAGDPLTADGTIALFATGTQGDRVVVSRRDSGSFDLTEDETGVVIPGGRSVQFIWQDLDETWHPIEIKTVRPQRLHTGATLNLNAQDAGYDYLHSVSCVVTVPDALPPGFDVRHVSIADTAVVSVTTSGGATLQPAGGIFATTVNRSSLHLTVESNAGGSAAVVRVDYRRPDGGGSAGQVVHDTTDTIVIAPSDDGATIVVEHTGGPVGITVQNDLPENMSFRIIAATTQVVTLNFQSGAVYHTSQGATASDPFTIKGAYAALVTANSDGSSAVIEHTGETSLGINDVTVGTGWDMNGRTVAGAATWSGQQTFSVPHLPRDLDLTTAQSVNAGAKKTFQASATTAGLRLGGVTADPSAPVSGDMWYRSDTGRLIYQGTAAIRTLVTNGLGANLTNKDISDATNTYRAASATVVGATAYATAAEATTGSLTTKALTPNAIRDSEYGVEEVELLCFGNDENVVVGNAAGGVFFRVPAKLNGWNLIRVAAAHFTAGGGSTPATVNFRRIRAGGGAVAMLSTAMIIELGETDTMDSATPGTIDTANDDVLTGDIIRPDVDNVGVTTPPKGLVMLMSFRKP